MRAAASRSSRFVYDSSLPCRTSLRAEAGRRRTGFRVPRGLLMRVLAVAKISHFFDGEIDPVGQLEGRPEMPGSGLRRALHAVAVDLDCSSVAAIVVSYSAVCAKALSISSNLNASVGLSSSAGQQPRIVGRVDDDEHVAEIFRRGAHERRSADVDLLDQRVERRRRIRGRLRERIQVDDDDVDQADAVARERREIVGTIAARENAAVERRDAAS